jgi:Coenzyme PQQ synthesis protein D (PqqD)
MYLGQDSDQKHLFSHTNSNSCDTFKRVAAQAVARDEGVLSEKSGLHVAPLVLQTASARPEAVCFELRHFCRRESVKSDPNAMWLVSPDVRSTYSEDGAVLLDIRKGLCYSLNPAAARVWSTVEASPSGIDFPGLVEVMETHYKISHEQLESDITEYLAKLEEMGLVQRNGEFHGSKAAGARG